MAGVAAVIRYRQGQGPGADKHAQLDELTLVCPESKHVASMSRQRRRQHVSRARDRVQNIHVTDEKVVQWLTKHDHVFGELHEAVTKTSEAAGQASRLIAANVSAAGSGEALAAVRENARRLLAGVRRARRFPPCPDEQTAIAFSAGLERWVDASETLVAAAEHRDVPEIQRAERALDAGLDEFLRMAEALRRATGQQHPTISGAT